MQKITSRQNPLIKELKKITSQKKHREKNNLVALDGVHLCEEFLKKSHNFSHLIFSEKFLKHPESQKFQKYINKKSHLEASALGRDLESIITLPDDLFIHISPTENPIGILIITHKSEIITSKYPLESENLKGSNNKQNKFLLLDSIQDPGNLGTLLRTAAAAGIQEVHCNKNCAEIFSPKVLRAAMGAHFQIPIFENANFQEFAKKFRKKAGKIYGLALDKTAKNIFESPLTKGDLGGFPQKNIAYMLGSEGLGITEENLDLCHQKIYIPMQNNIESLNVGVCGGIIMFL